MGVTEINQRLLQETQEIDLYSEKVKVSSAIISALLDGLKDVRARRKVARESKPVEMVDRGSSPAPKKLSRRELQTELQELKSILWEKECEIKSKNAEIKELIDSCQSKDKKIEQLRGVELAVPAVVRALMEQVNELSQLHDEEPSVEIDPEEIKKAKDKLKKQ